MQADRLDYTLRDSVSFGCLLLDEARKISADLTASRDGRFCFKSVQSAKRIAEACMQADEFAWSNPTHSLMYKYAVRTNLGSCPVLY